MDKQSSPALSLLIYSFFVWLVFTQGTSRFIVPVLGSLFCLSLLQYSSITLITSSLLFVIFSLFNFQSMQVFCTSAKCYLCYFYILVTMVTILSLFHVFSDVISFLFSMGFDNWGVSIMSRVYSFFLFYIFFHYFTTFLCEFFSSSNFLGCLTIYLSLLGFWLVHS